MCSIFFFYVSIGFDYALYQHFPTYGCSTSALKNIPSLRNLRALCTVAGQPVVIRVPSQLRGDRGSTLAKVLCYKSEGRWFNPRWCQWVFH
jgi:hypothetical protein